MCKGPCGSNSGRPTEETAKVSGVLNGESWNHTIEGFECQAEEVSFYFIGIDISPEAWPEQLGDF